MSMLTTTSTSTTASTALLNTNNTGIQLNNFLASYSGDLSSCLANCSNQGICILNLLQQYICQCNQFRTGSACQSDTRPCSSGPCLNGGICTDTNNSTSFECTCQTNLYFGIHCENKIDLCLNSSICFNNQGFCIMNGSQAMCKCKLDYSGVNCEIMSTSLTVRKAIINGATIIAIVVLACFILLIIFFDYTKYFLMNNKKSITTDNKKKKFYYHP